MTPLSPQIAVVVRTAGRDPIFLQRALASISAQTTTPAEVLVLNVGGEADPVQRVVDGCGLRAGVVTVKHASKLAQPVAANHGVMATRAEWITFLDDDDTWDPGYLERTGEVIGREATAGDFGGVVTQTVAVHEKVVDRRIRELRRKPFNPGLHAVDLALLVSANQFTNNALVFRRSAFLDVGHFREDLPLLYDWEFNVRLAARFRVECVPVMLARYHFRPARGNSPNSPQHDMERTVTRIRNEWLRADLAAGRIGLGQLALAGETVGVGRIMAGWARVRHQLRRWFRRNA